MSVFGSIVSAIFGDQAGSGPDAAREPPNATHWSVRMAGLAVEPT